MVWLPEVKGMPAQYIARPAPAFSQTAQWSVVAHLVFIALVQIGFELLVTVLPKLFAGMRQLPRDRGRHLDKLGTLDLAFIRFNRIVTSVMTYQYLQHAVWSPRVPWYPDELTFANTVLALPLCFIVYDLPYTLVHRLMHVRSLYPLVHKHHHRQIVPTRGNTDAINVHPVEFIFGEYNHLFAVWATSHLLGGYGGLHAYTCLAFIFIGGGLASLNHTRCDVRILKGVVFDVRAHDLHHRIPQSNYGQYIMFWDRIMGSFREYD